MLGGNFAWTGQQIYRMTSLTKHRKGRKMTTDLKE